MSRQECNGADKKWLPDYANKSLLNLVLVIKHRKAKMGDGALPASGRLVDEGEALKTIECTIDQAHALREPLPPRNPTRFPSDSPVENGRHVAEPHADATLKLDESSFLSASFLLKDGDRRMILGSFPIDIFQISFFLYDTGVILRDVTADTLEGCHA